MGDDSLGAGKTAGPHIIVIALGQEFRRDDAAGICAVRSWLEMFQPRKNDQEITVEFAGLPGVNLLFLMEGYYAAVLVDAMQSGSQPGTVNTVQVSDLESFSSSADNGHGWGAAETLLLGQQLMPDKMPQQIVLIGIEAENMEEGLGLTHKVQEAIPEAATAIEVYVRNILSHYFTLYK